MVLPHSVSRAFALTVALAAAPTVASPAAFRVADIETAVDTRGSSSPLLQVRLGDWLYFSATDALHGEELWRTDGTAAGTALVADICPGRCSSRPRSITAGAGRLLFSVELELLGREPWSSDGTAEGTHALGDICPGRCSSVELFYGQRGAALGDLTLFVAYDGAGRELWRTDGSPTGTFLVADIWPGMSGSDPRDLTAFAGRVYFAAYEPTHGSELWSSDGTAAGTRLVNDFSNGPFGSLVAVLGAIPSGLLVRETTGTVTDLWVVQSSGLLRPLGDAPCHADCGAVEVESVGDWMALITGNALWRTDLTPAGTVWIAPIPIGLHTVPQAITRAGNRVFFTGNGADLWVSDGTAQGTHVIHSLGWSVGGAYGPLALTAMGDDIIFVAQTSGHGYEPWISDGTDAGTHVLDLAPGPPSSISSPYDYRNPSSLAELGGRVLFNATTADTGCELWTTDDSATGAHLLADIYRDAGSNPAGLAAWRGRLHFSAQHEGSGFDEWTSDGTAADTALLRALPEGNAPSREHVAFGDHLYFAAADPPARDQLWRTDGTTGGTQPLDGTDGAAHGLTVLGSRLLLLANPEDQGCYDNDCSELMALDTGAGEVSLVKEINPSVVSIPYLPDLPVGARAHDLTLLGDRLLFAASDGGFEGSVGDELWISDGTPGGTQPLIDLCSGSCGSFPRHLRRLGDWVIFTTGNSLSWRDLWRTDGTAAGTVELHSFAAAGPVGGPLSGDFAVSGPRAYFLVATEWGDELWATDGTSAGTIRVSDLSLDGSQAWARRLTAVGERLYLGVYHASTGEELWTSDGTAAGTRLVADLAPGAASSAPTELTAIEGLLAFAAADRVSGLEPWISDGTASGTYRLQDIAPGAASSSPEEFTRFGDLLVFTAGDPEHGRELWAARWSDVVGGRCRSTATTLCLQGGRFAVTVRWTTASASGDGHAVPRTDESGLFWFFGAANTELIVKVLDGSAVNGKFWVFFNSLSDVEYDVDVVDAASGARRTYHHARGNLCGQADTSAFPSAAAAGAVGAAADPYASGANDVRRIGMAEPLDLAAADLVVATSVEPTCTASATTLCLQHHRFAVQVDFLDPLHGGAVTAALAIPDGEESGLFSFFGGANFELGVKLLDGRSVNGKHWLFHAALTDVDYTLHATDTPTGATRSYHHATGQLCGGADTSAF